MAEVRLVRKIQYGAKTSILTDGFVRISTERGRFMKKKRFKGLLSSILFAVLIVAVSVPGAVLFSRNIHDTFKEEVISSLSEIARQSVETLDREVNRSLQSLKDVASLMGQQEPLNLEAAVDSLDQIAQGNHFKRMGLIGLDGKAYTTDNEVLELGDREYFREALDGKATVSDALSDRVGGGKIHVFSAPVYQYGQVYAVLFATYSTENLQEILQIQSFEGAGYSYVVKQNGDTVVETTCETGFKNMANLFEAMRNADPRNGEEAAQARSEMEQGKTGIVEFDNKEHKYLCYTPLHVNDWYLITVVPSHVADEKMDKVMAWSYGMAGLMALLFLLLMLNIVRILYNGRRQLKKLAYVDELTGGRNLSKFKLDAAEILIRNRDRKYAMVSVDVDKFKYINDVFGYQEGNRVIRFIAEQLEKCLLPGEICGHKGADDFVLLLHNDLPGELSARVGQLCRDIRVYPQSDGRYYELVISMGIYEIESPDQDMDTLIDRAETPRKTIKGSHTVHYAFFDAAIREKLLYEHQLENKMSRALEHGDFVVYYQPQYDAQTRALVGAEALVRWLDPEWGLISPGQFIPLFEANGFVTELDGYVFGKVCRQIREWLDLGLPVVPISVNLSRLHLYNAHFVDEYRAMVEKYRIPSKLVQLELTESAFFNNRSTMLYVMDSLHQCGFTLLIDDFGTGYSSLNMLGDLPVDILKLDQEFIRGSADNDKGKQIIRSIIGMARTLHVTVIAEGVETEEQYQFLRDAGCDQIQGFYFARPMNTESYESLIKRLK